MNDIYMYNKNTDENTKVFVLINIMNKRNDINLKENLSVHKF